MDNNFLTPRLLAITSMVDKGSKIADVGCDHGYIPIYLAENNIIDFAIAADVNDGPLLSAEENIKKHGLSHKIKTRKSDGLKNILPFEYDFAIIAGMGGVLISEILSLAPKGKTLVLQPMTGVDYLMKYISDNGYTVSEHKLVKEEKHIYNILKVKDGFEKIDGVNLYIGKHIEKNELYYEYCKKLLEKFEKIIAGHKKSKEPDMEAIKKFNEYRSEILAVLRNGECYGK